MKIIKFLSISILAFSLAGCLGKKTIEIKDTPTEKTVQTGDKKTASQSSGDDTLDLFGANKKIKNLSECKDIKNINEKANCIDNYNYYLSESQHDVSLCEKLSDSSKKELCRKNYLSKTSVNNDSSDNASQETSKNNRAVDNAFIKDDINVCAALTDIGQKNRCVQNYLKTKTDKSGVCNKATDATLKKICINQGIYILAQQKSNANACNSISDAILRDGCISSIKMTNAQNSSSDADCNALKDATNKANCLNARIVSSSIKNQDTSSCDKLSGNEKQFCLDNYYLSSAIAKKDKSLCSKISSENIKRGCELDAK